MPVAEPIYLSTQAEADDGGVEPEVPDVDDIDPPQDDIGRGDDDRDPSRWMTVATFWQPTEAHLARLKLESEEIDCVLIDENLVAMDWLYANAVGGIKLRVPESELLRARQILAERPAPMARTAEDEAKHPSVAAEFSDGVLHCPDCGSTDLDRPFMLRRNIWALCAMMLLATTVLFIALPLLLVVYFIWLRPHHCRACANVWTATSTAKGFEVRASGSQNPLE